MNTENEHSKESAPSSSSQEVLLQEETLMKYFSGLIQSSFGPVQSVKRTNGHMKVHWRVSGTAIVFFRQFYMKNDFLQHDPRIIMLAAVFLAGKIEECRVSIRDLLEVYDKCTAENIKACELLLIESLEFNFSIKHPQSYVHTLIADFKRLSSEMSSSREGQGRPNGAMDVEGEGEGMMDKESSARREWSVAAENTLNTLQLSNAALLFSPLVIAISAMKATEPSAAFSITMDDFLFKRFGHTASALIEQYSKLESMMEIARAPIDLVFLKTVCMERLKKDSVWSKAKVKKTKAPPSVVQQAS